jgi:hypothetical protein
MQGLYDIVEKTVYADVNLEKKMARNISSGRKIAYYSGGMIMLIGIISFGSVFFSAIQHHGDFNNFESQSKSMMTRAFGGIALIVVGGVISGIGARGAAGSGLILDPEQARDDLEPYTRMAGGMVQDVLDEADIHIGGSDKRPAESKRIVMIKCRHCSKLNEEDSKFCQECGKPL